MKGEVDTGVFLTLTRAAPIELEGDTEHLSTAIAVAKEWLNHPDAPFAYPNFWLHKLNRGELKWYTKNCYTGKKGDRDNEPRRQLQKWETQIQKGQTEAYAKNMFFRGGKNVLDLYIELDPPETRVTHVGEPPVHVKFIGDTLEQIYSSTTFEYESVQRKWRVERVLPAPEF